MITTLPYDGVASFEGTSSFYQYTTVVGGIGVIRMFNLADDVDLEVYTDASFSTLDSNWVCVAADFTSAESCVATKPVAMDIVLHIKAVSFANDGSAFALNVAPFAGEGTAGSPVVIATLPYNGMVDIEGTSSFYQYTTVIGVNRIDMSNLTDDVDPKVYTDASFSTLDSNWVCTIAFGSTADNCVATIPVALGTVLYIKADSFAIETATFTLSVVPTI